MRENPVKIAVLVSGGGTNLQALIDAQNSGIIKSGKIELYDWRKFRWFETCIAIERIYNIYNEEWLLELVKILKEQGVDYSEFIPLWERPLNRWSLETHIVNIAISAVDA